MHVYIHMYIHIYIHYFGKQLLQNLQVFLHDPVRDAQVILGSAFVFVLVILGPVFVFATKRWLLSMCRLLWHCYGALIHIHLTSCLVLIWCLDSHGVLIHILLTSCLVLLFFLESVQVITVLHPTPCLLHPKLKCYSKLNCSSPNTLSPTS